MKNITDYRKKNVLVLGLAKSGFAAATLLNKLGANVVVNDQKPLEINHEAETLKQQGIEVICGNHPEDLLDRGFDLIVKNPGIPYSNPVIQDGFRRNLSIITEVELAYQITEADIMGITGSNGKTTTTTLIYEMMRREKDRTFLAGNIGKVSCEVAQQTKKDDLIVMELSSFQLMGIETFKPKIAILLNLFNAHLDYHGTKEEYGKAKANIVKNQTSEDFCVINADDAMIVSLTEQTKAQKVFFSTTQKVHVGAYIKDDAIYFNKEKIINLTDVVLPGKHNLENILAAVCAVKLYGLGNSSIREVLQTFAGVKHRLQFVESVKDRKFFNDSKATNILATQKAITSFEDPIILLAGGLDRGNTFDELVPALKNVKAVVTFGQTSGKITDAAKKAGIKIIKHVDNVETAVPAAYEMSAPNDIILLSPACASWDQYKTFEERGDIFINAVHKLK